MAPLSQIAQSIQDIARTVADDQTAVQRGTQPRYPGGARTPDAVIGAPHIRRGEDPLTSRPFYLVRAALAITGQMAGGWDEAKFERDESEKLKRALSECYGSSANYSRDGFVVPLDWSLLPDQVQRSSDFMPMRQAMHEAVRHIAPEYLDSRRLVDVYDSKHNRDLLRQGGELQRTGSYIDQAQGGAMVAPPAFGELIPILRNKSVLNNIGATIVPLPPQGTVKYPRQTGVTTIKQKPENTAGDETNITTDDVTLEPKQFIGLSRASNQLFNFSQGMAEMAYRNDLMEQIALTFDLAGLEGTGGPNRIKGIINEAGVGSVSAKTAGADGDTWQPLDVSRMIAKNMDRNSDVKTWIMRPRFWLGITETRADATVPGDKSGPYLFNMLRLFGDDFGETLRQRKVVTSNQISAARTKGAGTALTYMIGVDGPEVLIGMHGAIILDANPYETTAYAANQTLLRAIMFGDVSIRRGAGVVVMDNLIMPNNLT